MLRRVVTVKVDRPLGSFHPKHKDIYYPINYGYIEGIMAQKNKQRLIRMYRKGLLLFR